MGASMEVTVPDIGDFEAVVIIEILAQVGDRIDAGQPLLVVESDKASLEIPSSGAGILKELKVALGDKVSQGTPVAVLEAAADVRVEPLASTAKDAAPEDPPAAAPAAPPEPISAPVPASTPNVPAAARLPHAGNACGPGAAAGGTLPHASPAVRRLARELGVPLDRVSGSGPRQRITQEDLHRFVKQALGQAASAAKPAAPGAVLPGLLPLPNVDHAKFGPVEHQPLSRIKKLSGANLWRNWLTIPHVTNHEEADITELEAFRVRLNQEHAKSGTKVTLLAFLIKAAAATLQRFPDFNASLDGDNIVLKRYFHIGFAADTPQGLVVPVVRDADRKGILELSGEVAALAAKARDGKLGPAEMSGGCFSISSLGGIGGTYFTPIINAPEVAILGVGKSALLPRWDGSAFQPRLILPLSLSWDHRAVDGAAAGRFNAHFAALLADFRRLLL